MKTKMGWALAIALQVLPVTPLASEAMGQQAGESLVLPEFNPAPSLEKIANGMQKLDPVAKSLREALAKISPLIEEYKINPTLDNQGKLEVAVSGFVSGLSKDLRKAGEAREHVTFAFQDLLGGVRTLSGAIARQQAEQLRRATAARDELNLASATLAAAAEEWDSASAEDKPKAMESFKKLYREREIKSFRARMLAAMTPQLANVVNGVKRLNETFAAVAGRVNDVFDSIGAAGEMLNEAADTRAQLVALTSMYNNLLGSGNGSIRNVLTSMQSVQGQLAAFESVLNQLSSTDVVAPMLADFENIVPEGGKPGAPGVDPWAARIEAVIKEAHAPAGK